ncbi:LacI family DNA-binding transcriptional regulator [Saccharophagus degradans]|uniref:LacI family DNA-binding transcriptional regulator n=1 Tax=Saccharophagus degradans TaxID=86304 RepID=UPI002477DCD9|nr:LacI family DNA-binding transcriptional regulator [Saccharophagus degradans]WGO98600.1 LacI family DNA-binding transcriptional regulator [Saccharophagus degradans]
MSKPTKKPTPQMSDIARLAGVSKSTVSRALANSPLVNQETKDLVQKIAREQNYRLNTVARNFRLKESLTIAVLIPSAGNAGWRLSDPFFLELLGSIAEAVDRHDHQLLLSRTSAQDSDWIEDFVNKRRADGIILIGQGSQHEAINKLAATFKAVSVWGAKIDEHQHYPVVGSDNVLGGLRATAHLIERGRKRILFLGYNTLPEVSQRYRGYCDAHASANLAIDPKLQVATGSDESDGYLAVINAIESNIDFDGVFAVSDVLAMSAIRALQERKISVPKDVSVVGYDDIALASYYNPPITTIHQNRSAGGKILVDNLLEAIEGHKPEMISLNPELIIRGSS